MYVTLSERSLGPWSGVSRPRAVTSSKLAIAFMGSMGTYNFDHHSQLNEKIWFILLYHGLLLNTRRSSLGPRLLLDVLVLFLKTMSLNLSWCRLIYSLRIIFCSLLVSSCLFLISFTFAAWNNFGTLARINFFLFNLITISGIIHRSWFALLPANLVFIVV